MGLLHGISLLALICLAFGETGGYLVLPVGDAWRVPVQPSSLAVSGDGRFVAFSSYARLVPIDTNDTADIYVFDARSGHVSLESVGRGGRTSKAASFNPALSADGRVLVFESFAHDLVKPTQPELRSYIYVRDRQRGETRRIDGAHGAIPNSGSYLASLSADGRFVAFESNATNLVSGRDANGEGADVYLADLASGSLVRVSLNSAGEQAALGTSFMPSLSADGTRVAFTSTADIECAGARASCPPWRQDTNGLPDVYVRDLRSGITRRVTRGADGSETLAPSHHPALSGDGRFVAFVSVASNIVAGDRNRHEDVFLHDLETGTTMLVSRRADGKGTADGRSLNPSISMDGRYVAFQSTASNLVCARRCPSAQRDRNDTWDVFLFDRHTGRTTLVSAEPGTAPPREPSTSIVLDGRGRLMAFLSARPTGAAKKPLDYDLFLRWMTAPHGTN